MKTLFPLPGAVVTSKFGMRNGTMHNGIDLSKGQGSPILAYADGKVIVANVGCSVGNDTCGNGGGNWVEIDHGNGYTTRYLHLTQNFVKVGQQVKAGQQIGTEGNTGHSRGSHLHFEIKQISTGQKLDPYPYLFLGLAFPDSTLLSSKNLKIGLLVFVAVGLLVFYFRREVIQAYKQGFEKAKSLIK